MVARRAAALACVVLLAGCIPDHDGDGVIRIACLGDSNTFRSSPAPTWCGRLAELLPSVVASLPGNTLQELPAAFANVSRPGAAAADQNPPPLADGPEQLELALAWAADVVIFAFGTNDVIYAYENLPGDPGVVTTEEIQSIVAAHQALFARAEDIVALVALAPPVYQPACCGACGEPVLEELCVISQALNDAIHRVNDGLRSIVPARRIVDFFSIVSAEDPADFLFPIHFTETAHQKRALEAERVLLLQ